MDEAKKEIKTEIGTNISETPPTWMEQDPILRELWLSNEKPETIAKKLGRSVAAVMTRAARLGLPRRSAPGRKPGSKNREIIRKRKLFDNREDILRKRSHEVVEATSMRGVRVCLMCLRRFESEGRHNRICSICKSSSEYGTGSGIPEMFRNF